MNCKPGDLAVFVRSTCGNEGVIVRCLSLSMYTHTVNPNGVFTETPIWNVDKLVRGWDGSFARLASDCNLRPIRDPGDDAVDETLIWAGDPRVQRALVDEVCGVQHG